MDGTNTERPAKCCKGCGCEIDYSIRGLCRRCYQILRAAVATGQTTWSEAESKGACLPRGVVTQGRPAKFATLFPMLAGTATNESAKS